MIYVLFAMLFAAILFLCAAPCFFQSRRALAAAFAANIAMLLVGVIFLLLSRGLVGAALADASLDADFCAWAKDLSDLWARLSGIAAAFLGGIVLLAALIRHPWRRIRMCIAAASAFLLLLFGLEYAVVAENATVDLVTPVCLWAAGCAALMTAGAAVDSFFARRKWGE